MDDFGDHLETNGISFKSTDEESEADVVTLHAASSFEEHDILSHPQRISSSCLAEDIRERIDANRGQEPAELFSPAVISDVVHIQTSRWEHIAKFHADRCLAIAQQFFTHALFHTAPAHIAVAVLQQVAEDHFVECAKKLNRKLKKLLKPFTVGPVIASRRAITLFEWDEETIRAFGPLPYDDGPLQAQDIYKYACAYYQVI